jgi:hypothetical protein
MQQKMYEQQTAWKKAVEESVAEKERTESQLHAMAQDRTALEQTLSGVEEANRIARQKEEAATATIAALYKEREAWDPKSLTLTLSPKSLSSLALTLTLTRTLTLTLIGGVGRQRARAQGGSAGHLEN